MTSLYRYKEKASASPMPSGWMGLSISALQIEWSHTSFSMLVHCFILHSLRIRRDCLKSYIHVQADWRIIKWNCWYKRSNQVSKILWKGENCPSSTSFLSTDLQDLVIHEKWASIHVDSKENLLSFGTEICPLRIAMESCSVILLISCGWNSRMEKSKLLLFRP